MKWFKKIFPPVDGERINTITIKKSDIAAIHINHAVGTSSFITDDIKIETNVIRDVGIFEYPGFRYDKYIHHVFLSLNFIDRANNASIAEISYIKEVDRILYSKDVHIAETMRLPAVESYTLKIFETGGTTHTFDGGSNEIRSIDNKIEIEFDKYRLRKRE